MQAPTGVLGVLALIALAWLMSERRSRFPARLVIAGVLLQLVFGVLFLRAPGVVQLIDGIARLINGVIKRADAGIAFIFGEQLADPQGPLGLVFAFKVLPVIIFFASLMAVLYHVGLMQRIVAAFAWLLRRLLGVTGAEALAMASNVFVGQTEAPLCIRPYLDRLTRAQLATLMVGGFATIAGSVLAGYVAILGGGDEVREIEFIKHLLTASVMSAPAAFVIARILVPEVDQPMSEDVHAVTTAHQASNVLDAAAHGATEGLRLALNVGAMLIAFVSLLALINWPLEAIGRIEGIDRWLTRQGVEDLGLEVILGWIFMPLAWLMGVESSDTHLVGSLMGQKLVLTEFIAYDSLGDAMNHEDGPLLTDRSAKIAAYALCGFANFASIAIQIGGLTILAPGRRKDIVSLSLRAMFGGALASWMTAAIAGLLIAG